MELKTQLGGMTGDPKKDVEVLKDYTFQLTEELRYLLNNLDVTNFNDLGLARYEKGRLQVYSETVELAVGELSVKVKGETDAIKKDMATMESSWTQKADSIESKVTSVKGSVTNLTGSVNDLRGNVTNLTGNVTRMESRITQNANSISAVVTSVGSNGTVTGASIVAAINRSGSSVKISADHVSIQGFVTFEDLSGNGTTNINGSNIRSGTIEGITVKGCTLISQDPYDRWRGVTIEDGMVRFQNGGTITSVDSSVLAFSGNYIRMSSSYSFMFEFYNGSYWLLDQSGMGFFDSRGNQINGFMLQK